MSERLCTFYRDGSWCARPEADESVHVWPNERMRPGAHVWRHDPKVVPRMKDDLTAAKAMRAERSEDYNAGYQAGYHAGQRSRGATP
jgi:hypothetical protein